MKKKAIKIAASTAVAASAFVAAAPAQQADAATNVNQLATDAQNAGTVLKWAISVEGSADFVTRPYDQYNAAKKAIAAAEAAGKKLSTSEKLSLDAKLVDAKLQVKRAAAYIDAITSSEKIKDLTSKLDAAIASGDIEKVETAYHNATGEYRKQAKLLDRVYGQSTRDEIRNAVKPAIEKSVASVKNEVTVNMLVKAAAKDIAAGNIADAHAKYAEAQAILDANVLKWETALQKSVTDAKAAAPAIPGNVTVETAAFHGEIGQTYAVVANFKTSNGALYNGPVKLSFVDSQGVANSDYKFVTVNGQSTGAGGTTTATADAVNGKVVVTVTSATAIAGGKVVFTTHPNGLDKAKGETVKSDTLNFYTPAGNGALLNPNNDSGTVKYVDVANNYFVTNELVKYVLKTSGSVYQDTNNAVLTTDAFKAKLTKGDRIEGTYYKESGSTLKLVLDYVAGATFAVDQSDEVVSSIGAIRTEGNSAKLSGTGEAGKMVYVYKTSGGTPVAQAQVGSNGLWSTSVAVAGTTEFAVRQAPYVNYVAPAYVAEASDEKITFIPGKFTVTPTATNGVVSSNDSLTGDTFVFDAAIAEDGNSTAVVASNAQITLIDGDLTRATYVNGVNNTVIEESADGFTVTFGAPTSISGGNNVLNGVLTVNNVTGVTNAYKLKVNVSGSISGY